MTGDDDTDNDDDEDNDEEDDDDDEDDDDNVVTQSDLLGLFSLSKVILEKNVHVYYTYAINQVEKSDI